MRSALTIPFGKTARRRAIGTAQWRTTGAVWSIACLEQSRELDKRGRRGWLMPGTQTTAGVWPDTWTQNRRLGYLSDGCCLAGEAGGEVVCKPKYSVQSMILNLRRHFFGAVLDAFSGEMRKVLLHRVPRWP